MDAVGPAILSLAVYGVSMKQNIGKYCEAPLLNRRKLHYIYTLSLNHIRVHLQSFAIDGTQCIKSKIHLCQNIYFCKILKYLPCCLASNAIHNLKGQFHERSV